MIKIVTSVTISTPVSSFTWSIQLLCYCVLSSATVAFTTHNNELLNNCKFTVNSLACENFTQE